MTEEMKQALEIEATKEGLAYVDNINRGESPWTDSDMELAYEDGMIAGAEWMYEQMMRNAMPCTLGWYDGFVPEFSQEQLHDVIERNGLNVGDRISVIIIKED